MRMHTSPPSYWSGGILWAGMTALAMVLGCEALVDQSPAATPNVITQNNNYTTNVYTAVPPTKATAEPAGSATEHAPVTAEVAEWTPTHSEAMPPPSTVAASAPSTDDPPTAQPTLPRKLVSTGIAQCDAYLSRVELCSAAMLPSTPEGQAGLERRSWRRAAASHQVSREILTDECSTSLRMYNKQVPGLCR